MVDKVVGVVEPKDFTLDLQYVTNKNALLDLFDNVHFKQLLHDKSLVLTLVPQVDVNKSPVSVKKKSSNVYIINSFIIYTSFLSKADIKLKKDNKSWQMMGALENGQPVDTDGYEFRKLIEELEVFHKKLLFDDGDRRKTTILRKRVINYAQALLIASYRNIETPRPEDVTYTDKLDENDVSVDEKYVKAGNELYRHAENFRVKTERFKLFLSRHNLIRDPADVYKRPVTVTEAELDEPSTKRSFSVDMSNDTDEVNELEQFL
ncbi:39k [Clostera anachoreta granulovirus]|uniref:39k n=1 Tax=Clostera anachoreta granulovirus TaxID=283675 RepID=F4ZKS3_9BBAC|nr:39k [Clostera anachoreta granulovirus]AEB00334.1 39k [Clostera anachoreta granulovirus]